MKKERFGVLEKQPPVLWLKAVLIEAVTAFLAVLLFSVLLLFVPAGFRYAAFFATVSLGIGCFFAALFTARKIGKKGWLIGLAVGGITFLLVTAIALLAGGGFTVTTLFRMAILLLCALIGGVLGVG